MLQATKSALTKIGFFGTLSTAYVGFMSAEMSRQAERLKMQHKEEGASVSFQARSAPNAGVIFEPVVTTTTLAPK